MTTLLAIALAASAAGLTPEEATARFNQGVEHAEKGDYAAALKLWLETAESLPVDYRPYVHLNIGQAYEKLGRLGEAWHHLGIYLESVKDDAETAATRDDVAKRLSSTHRDVKIVCTPEGSTIRLAGGRAYPCPLRWWFQPGDQTVRVEPPGKSHLPKDATFIVTMAKETQVVDVALDAAPPEAASSGGSGSGGAGSSNSGSAGGADTGVRKEAPPPKEGGKGLAWGLTIGGGAAIVVAVGLQFMAISAESDLAEKFPDGTPENPAPPENKQKYQDGYASDVQPKLIGAWTLAGLGVAATGVGIWLLVSDDGGGSTGAAPMVLPGGGGVVWQGRF